MNKQTNKQTNRQTDKKQKNQKLTYSQTVFAAHVLAKLTIFDEIMEEVQFDYFG